MNFKSLLAELDDIYEADPPGQWSGHRAAKVVGEVSQLMAAAGHAALVRAPVPDADVVDVKRYISACIAATTPLAEPGPPPLLSPPEVAELTGSAPETVIEWIKTGFLKASNLATGQRPRYMVKQADLDDFLASRQVPIANAFRARL